MNYKKILTPIAVIVAAIALVAVGWFGNNLYQTQQASAAKNTATTFVTNIASGDTVAAYDAMSPDVKENVSQEEFMDAWKVLTANSVDLSDPVVVNNDGTMYYSQTIYGLKEPVAGENNITLMLILNKDGSKWVVSSANVQ